MNRFASAAATLSAAVVLAMAIQSSVQADPAKDPTTPALKDKLAKLEKCYGVNAAAKNDCASGTHSCAGQSTASRDPKAFVLLPAGDCAKIAGGTTGAT
jgi:uncharacterized membrane protein